MDLPRVHLFEFEDLKWFPKTFRKCITDLLTYQMQCLGIYDATTDKVIEILNKTGHRTMIDLCSGSGGPAPQVRDRVSEELKEDINLILTDKYPNLEAFEKASNVFVRPILDSVDAMDVSPKLKGLRTLFTAFHHFKPHQAIKILQNAVDSKMPIAIFEITERKPASLLTLLVAPITCLLFSLFIRPLKFSRFLWTYFIPIIPFVYTWDGLISNARTYTKKEWQTMTSQLHNNEYKWETGELMSKFHIKITYLIGYPNQ